MTLEPRAKGIRNEPLDTRVYATGALEIFNPNFESTSDYSENRRTAGRQNSGQGTRGQKARCQNLFARRFYKARFENVNDIISLKTFLINFSLRESRRDECEYVF